MLKKGIHYLKNQKQLHHFSIYGAGQFFNLVTPLLISPYIILTCGDTNFGKTAVALSFIFFLIVFIDFGVDILGVKSVAIYRNDPKKLEEVFRTTFGLRFFNLILVCFLVSFIFWFVPFFNQEKELYFFSLFVVLGQALNPIWFFQGVEFFKQITWINLISKSSFLLAVFIFIKTENQYIYVNLFWGLGMILANSIALLWLVNKFGFKDLKPKKLDVLFQFRTQFSFFGSQIFVSIQQYAPIVLISYFGSNIMAFQYRIIEQVINVFKTYIVLFFNFLFPRVCFLIEDDPQKAIKTWGIYNGANLIFIILSMIFVFTWAEEIVTYFHVKEVSELSHYLKIATLIPIFYSISLAMKQLMLSKNLNIPYINITIILVGVSTLFLILAIPYFKLTGVLAVLLVTEFIFLILFAYFAIKIISAYMKSRLLSRSTDITNPSNGY